jgi:hypothetical protein
MQSYKPMQEDGMLYEFYFKITVFFDMTNTGDLVQQSLCEV